MQKKLTIFLLLALLSPLFAISDGGFVLPSAASAQGIENLGLANIDAAGLAISLQSGSSQAGSSQSGTPEYRLLIKPKGGIESLDKDLTANVFAVENPSRLVIDIPGFVASGPQTKAIANAVFSSIRLGVHQDKTRLVIDINDNQVPEYTVSSDADIGALVVGFSFSGNTSIVTEPMVEEPAASISLQEVEPVKVPTPVVEPEVEIEQPKIPAVRMPEPVAVVPASVPLTEPKVPSVEDIPEIEQPQVSGGIGVVKGVYYQAAKNSKTSSIMVDVDGLNQYSLSQAGPGAYELTLRNTMLKGSHLSLPQFPPDTFKGFEVIVASQAGSDVVVKVYTDEKVKLSPFIAQGKLWLRVIP